MAFIKSAFELAMEKTQGLSVDREELHRKEIFNQGRAAAAAALENGSVESVLKDREKELSKADFLTWRQGFSQSLLSRVTLHADTGPASELTRALGLLDELTHHKAGPLLKGMGGLLNQFKQELAQLREAIAQQVGPALRQRAAQMAQQTGANPQFILEKDPNYLKILSENLEPMKAEYSQNLEKMKEEYGKLL